MDKITDEEFMIPENLDNNNSSFIYGEMNYNDIAGILKKINAIDRLMQLID